jgi:DNA-binding transcriptional ArsR family regulator
VSKTPADPAVLRLTERQVERVADAMFAMSAPSRVRILACLRAGPCAVNEISEAIAMEQSAVSHQLRVLRDNRLVTVERQGRRRVYALHDEHVADLVDSALGHVERLAPSAGARGASSRMRARLRRSAD